MFVIMERLYAHPVYPTRCKVTQFIFIWKLLYMFLLLRSNSSTIAAGSSNGVKNTRCCR